VDILSLFPETFSSVLETSMLKKIQDKGLIDIRLSNIRDFSENKQAQVDDRPFGGGPGMVLMPGPVQRCIENVKQNNSHVVYFSPQGQPLNAKKSKELAEHPHLVFLCGHYEGIDQRVLDMYVDEELSIGDYVLTNGCLPAMVTLDSLMRFIPGALGHEEAAQQDSFENDLLDCPHYTRPDTYNGIIVPEPLRSGNHKSIAKWRLQQSLEKTRSVRPDLYYRYLGNKQNFQEETRPLNSALSQIVLPVENLKDSIDFYRHVLFLSLIEKDNTTASFQLSDGLDIILIEDKDIKSSLSFTLRFENETFLTAVQRLTSRSMAYSLSEQEDNTILQTCDPSGYQWNIEKINIRQDNHILEEIKQ
jgi:tRNA (guanine37-N1)-methyltransferase